MAQLGTDFVSMPVPDHDNNLAARFDAENERQRRWMMQRVPRANEDETARDLRRQKDNSARQRSRALLDELQRSQIAERPWWDRVMVLNSSEVPQPLGLSAREGQHAIRWFIHDPSAFFEEGEKFEIPRAWIDATLAGLNRVNPFIKKLQHTKASNRNDNIALQIEHSDTNTREIAAIISLAPASPPSRRKLVIHWKGNDKPIYLDILSPFVEPLHYLLLLPEGTLDWSPLRLTWENKKFSQARWYRTRFFMNAEQMSIFSCLTGKFFPATLLILSISRRMVG
jgi:hypothetical protein